LHRLCYNKSKGCYFFSLPAIILLKITIPLSLDKGEKGDRVDK